MSEQTRIYRELLVSKKEKRKKTSQLNIHAPITRKIQKFVTMRMITPYAISICKAAASYVVNTMQF